MRTRIKNQGKVLAGGMFLAVAATIFITWAVISGSYLWANPDWTSRRCFIELWPHSLIWPSVSFVFAVFGMLLTDLWFWHWDWD